MNQQKMGEFLKNLRKDKGLTQEQLAEHFNVSSRTISRWETGSNAPDIDMLIELADFYHVGIREIIDGERRGEIMTDETKETVKKVVEYSDRKTRIMEKGLFFFIVFVDIIHIFSIVIHESNGINGLLSEEVCHDVISYILGFSTLYMIIITFRGSKFVKKMEEMVMKIFRR